MTAKSSAGLGERIETAPMRTQSKASCVHQGRSILRSHTLSSGRCIASRGRMTFIHVKYSVGSGDPIDDM